MSSFRNWFAAVMSMGILVTMAPGCGTGGSAPGPAATHGISGTVTGAAGVTVTLTPGGALVVTDGSGNYGFSGLADGTYTVTPSKAGYAFTPPSASVAVAGADVTGTDFLATSAPGPTWSISGTVRAGPTPVAGVAVTLGGAASGATTTDAAGHYAFASLANGSYTVAAAQPGYAFTPPSASVAVAGADVTQDFAAAGTRQIAGTISVGARPLAGVSVARSGSPTPAVTGTDGAYAFAGLEPGSYAVTPTLAGYTFTPASLSVDVTAADAAGRDFAATAVIGPTWSISGTIRVGSTPVAGVAVALAGTASGATTDAAGHYAFANLANGSYTVAAAKPGYAFTPPSASVTVAGADVTQDFAAAGTRQIAGIISVGATPLAGVSVTRSGSPAPAVTGAAGTYAFTSLEPGTYTVTPALAGYTFTPASLSVDVTGADAAGRDFVASPVPDERLRLYLSGTSASTRCATIPTGARGGLCPTNPIPDGTTIQSFIYQGSPADWATALSGNLGGTGYGVTLQMAMPPSRTATGNAAIILRKGSAETVLFATETFTVDSSTYRAFTFTGTGTAASGVAGDELILRVTCLSGCSTGLGVLLNHHSDQTSYIDVPSSTAPSTWSISGTVRVGSAPVPGVAVALAGATSGAATTDAAGHYAFASLANGSYAVAAAKPGYVFTPPSANVTVAGADVTQDFAAAGTRQIAGTISVGATPLAGVSVTRSGSPAPAVTGAAGTYAFTSLEPGTYTVTPALAGYTFAPASLSVDVTGADAAGRDFAATVVAPTWSVSGTLAGASSNLTEGGAVLLAPTPCIVSNTQVYVSGLFVGFGSYADMCEVLATNGMCANKANATTATLVVLKAGLHAQSAVGAGNYAVTTATPPPDANGNIIVVTGTYYLTNGTCASTGGSKANGGTLTVSSVSATSVTGSVSNLAFADGSHLDGTFDVANCNATIDLCALLSGTDTCTNPTCIP